MSFVQKCLAVCCFLGMGSKLLGAELPLTPLEKVEYFDIGALQSENFLDSSGRLVADRIDRYTRMFFEDAWGQNIGAANLFALQVCDICYLIEEEYNKMSPNNALRTLHKKSRGQEVGGKSLFCYMVEQWTVKNGLRVGLTFGGKHASDADWNFGFDKLAPEQLAKSFAVWANNIGLNRLDFDVRNKAFMQNGVSELNEFFTTLKGSFKGFVTLTVIGDWTTWGIQQGNFYGLFDKVRFVDMFHYLNLIFFDGTKYYLNAGQYPMDNYDIFQWIGDLMENTHNCTFAQIALLINPGLNASIDYRNPKNCGGKLPYKKMPKGLTNGQASCFIYKELTKNLAAITKENIVLGNPFYQDSNADYEVSASNYYYDQFYKNTGNFELDFARYP